MTSPTTDRRQSERMRALVRANEVRHARAELKRRVGDGELSAAQIILAPPPDASSWPLVELLRSQHGWGEAKCRGFLANNQIHERKPIGTLTGRQRRLLAAQLTAADRNTATRQPGQPASPRKFARSGTCDRQQAAVRVPPLLGQRSSNEQV
jgi:hypothetical protein